jgi:hypothetical protein
MFAPDQIYRPGVGTSLREGWFLTTWMSGNKFPDAPREPHRGRLADLQPKATQNAAPARFSFEKLLLHQLRAPMHDDSEVAGQRHRGFLQPRALGDPHRQPFRAVQPLSGLVRTR